MTVWSLFLICAQILAQSCSCDPPCGPCLHLMFISHATQRTSTAGPQYPLSRATFRLPVILRWLPQTFPPMDRSVLEAQHQEMLCALQRFFDQFITITQMPPKPQQRANGTEALMACAVLKYLLPNTTVAFDDRITGPLYEFLKKWGAVASDQSILKPLEMYMSHLREHKNSRALETFFPGGDSCAETLAASLIVSLLHLARLLKEQHTRPGWAQQSVKIVMFAKLLLKEEEVAFARVLRPVRLWLHAITDLYASFVGAYTFQSPKHRHAALEQCKNRLIEAYKGFSFDTELSDSISLLARPNAALIGSLCMHLQHPAQGAKYLVLFSQQYPLLETQDVPSMLIAELRQPLVEYWATFRDPAPVNPSLMASGIQEDDCQFNYLYTKDMKSTTLQPHYFTEQLNPKEPPKWLTRRSDIYLPSNFLQFEPSAAPSAAPPRPSGRFAEFALSLELNLLPMPFYLKPLSTRSVVRHLRMLDAVTDDGEEAKTERLKEKVLRFGGVPLKSNLPSLVDVLAILIFDTQQSDELLLLLSRWVEENRANFELDGGENLPGPASFSFCASILVLNTASLLVAAAQLWQIPILFISYENHEESVMLIKPEVDLARSLPREALLSSHPNNLRSFPVITIVRFSKTTFFAIADEKDTETIDKWSWNRECTFE